MEAAILEEEAEEELMVVLVTVFVVFLLALEDTFDEVAFMTVAVFCGCLLLDDNLFVVVEEEEEEDLVIDCLSVVGGMVLLVTEEEEVDEEEASGNCDDDDCVELVVADLVSLKAFDFERLFTSFHVPSAGSAAVVSLSPAAAFDFSDDFVWLLAVFFSGVDVDFGLAWALTLSARPLK